MAFGLRLSSPLSLGLSLSSAFLASHLLLTPRRSRLLSCDNGPVSSSQRTSPSTPGLASRRSNARVYRQISGGSIAGLVAGLAVSTFSKTLALLIGLVVFGVQFAASRGVDIIPYRRMQKYVQGVNLRSALEGNVAFKLSFGMTFALAAFVRVL